MSTALTHQRDSEDLRGRTCVVTGATTGIGKETARGLAVRGAEVVLIGRDPKRSEAARAELAASAPEAKLHVLLADLSSLADVRRLGTEVAARFPRIDVLVNNAGAIFGERGLTVDGHERTFALNHLAYFLLTETLRETLVRSAAARVVNVSSAAHKIGRMHWDDFGLLHGYTQLKSYAQSKLANILHTRALSRRLAGTGVTANCLHPGTIASNFGQSGSSFFAWLARIGRPFLRSAEGGARTSIFLSASPDVKDVTGEYFVRCKVTRPSQRARSDEDGEQLWALSEALCDKAR